MGDVVRFPWSARPRLPYPTAPVPRLPEPNFQLIGWRAYGAPSDPVRVREEMHAEWHHDNPHRRCDYGSILPRG